MFPVDDSDNSQRAFDWMLKNFYRTGDEIHLVNVIPRIQFAATLGVPAVDFTPQINREAYEAAVRKAEAFIVKRFLSRLPAEILTTPIVHIVKVRGAWRGVHRRCCWRGGGGREGCPAVGGARERGWRRRAEGVRLCELFGWEPHARHGTGGVTGVSRPATWHMAHAHMCRDSNREVTGHCLRRAQSLRGHGAPSLNAQHHPLRPSPHPVLHPLITRPSTRATWSGNDLARLTWRAAWHGTTRAATVH